MPISRIDNLTYWDRLLVCHPCQRLTGSPPFPEERLRSRLEWGLIADLTAPDLETRIAIPRAKSEEGAVPISSDVIDSLPLALS